MVYAIIIFYAFKGSSNNGRHTWKSFESSFTKNQAKIFCLTDDAYVKNTISYKKITWNDENSLESLSL